MTAQVERDTHVPPELWGRDHWSTLAYIETVLVDRGGYRVRFDPRMRQSRRNFRVLAEALKGESARLVQRGIPMQPRHGSRLADGSTLEWHDDWCCAQDMLAAGLFEGTPQDWDVGFAIRLTPRGAEAAQRLRSHKLAGGSFSTATAATILP